MVWHYAPGLEKWAKEVSPKRATRGTRVGKENGGNGGGIL